MAEMTKQETLDLIVQAYKDLGFPTTENLTAEEITNLVANLSDKELSLLINQAYLIAEQRYHTNMFDASKNPLRKFMFDMRNNGWTIEDYMFHILEGNTPYWDNEYTDEQRVQDLVTKAEQEISDKKHMTPFAKQFKTTIDERQYPKFFIDATNVSYFVNGKIANLNSSAEIWLYKKVLIDEIKDLIADGVKSNETAFDFNTENGIKSALETVNTIYKDMLNPTDRYNKDGVVSITPDKEYLSIVAKPSVVSRIKTYIYSGAYQLDQLILPENVIEIPEDETLGEDSEGNEIQMLIFDRRAIVVGLRTWKTKTFEVPNSLWRNYWLSIEGVRGHNNFINAYAIKGTKLGNFLDGGTGENYSLTLMNYIDNDDTKLINSITIDDITYNFNTNYEINTFSCNKTIGIHFTDILKTSVISIIQCLKINGEIYTYDESLDSFSVGNESVEVIFDFKNKKLHIDDNNYDLDNSISNIMLSIDYNP